MGKSEQLKLKIEMEKSGLTEMELIDKKLREKLWAEHGKSFLFTDRGRFIWKSNHWEKDVDGEIFVLFWNMRQPVLRELGMPQIKVTRKELQEAFKPLL